MSMGLRAGELARMTTVQTGHMMDTCQILAYSSTTNAYGLPAAIYTAGAAIACGYDFGRDSGPEVQGQSFVPMPSTKIRLPKATAVASTDRLRLTHRFGVALAPSVDYAIIGDPELGPSGLVAKVELITDGS